MELRWPNSMVWFTQEQQTQSFATSLGHLRHMSKCQTQKHSKVGGWLLSRENGVEMCTARLGLWGRSYTHTPRNDHVGDAQKGETIISKRLLNCHDVGPHTGHTHTLKFGSRLNMSPKPLLLKFYLEAREPFIVQGPVVTQTRNLEASLPALFDWRERLLVIFSVVRWSQEQHLLANVRFWLRGQFRQVEQTAEVPIPMPQWSGDLGFPHIAAFFFWDASDVWFLEVQDLQAVIFHFFGLAHVELQNRKKRALDSWMRVECNKCCFLLAFVHFPLGLKFWLVATAIRETCQYKPMRPRILHPRMMAWRTHRGL